MSFTDTFSTPDDFGDLRASELHSSLGEQLGAEAGEAFMGGTRSLIRSSQYLGATHGVDPLAAMGAADAGFAGMQIYSDAMADQAAQPDVPIADAKARVKQEGLEGQLKLPDQDTIRGPVLDMMVQDAHERQQYAAAVNRGPQGFLPDALGMATQIGAGMIDPVNAAAFSIPVLGEARYGMLMARAGESVAARAALRTGVGAAQGFAGGAALVPADWWLHTQDGQDYTFADALKSVVLSAGMGGAFHGGFGAIGDVASRIRGMPLSGSIEDLRARALAGDTHAADIVQQLGSAGVHLPEEALEPGGVDTDQVPGISAGLANIDQPITPVHPAEVLADLPPPAREDVTRAAIADVIKGEPVQAGELLQEAAKEDPRVAESIEAWHGSPHDFDQFDSSRIGTGEGAQSYGHGLYLAENEDVARRYQKSTSYADFIRKVQELYDEHEDPGEAEALINESKDFTPGQRELLGALKDDDYLGFDYPHQAVAAALKEPDAFDLSKRTREALHNVGNVYKVRVDANKEHFLDWDKPLNEQSEHVQNALLNHPDPEIAGTAEKWGKVSGADIYNRLAQRAQMPGADVSYGPRTPYGQRLTSVKLRDAGIPGIKYLDQGSRGIRPLTAEDIAAKVEDLKRDIEYARKTPEEGHDIESLQRQIEDWRAKKPIAAGDLTRNYVVFDDKLIRITHKNGEEVGLDELKAGQGGEPGLPKIDNTHDVVSGANSAKDPSGPVYVDEHIPQFSPKLKDRDGNPADLHKYLATHETTERSGMARAIAAFKQEYGREPNAAELDRIYNNVHTNIATPAERAAVEADGVSWEGYTKEIDGYLAKIEHEKATNPPTEPLHVDPEAAIGHHQSENKQSSAGAGPALPAARAKPAKAKPKSLLQFLSEKGGISDKDPLVSDLLQSFGGKNPNVPGYGKLVREGGRPLDRARESAVEAGYLHDEALQTGGVTESTINHLLEAIDAEARGTKQYPAGSEGFRSKEEQQAQEEEARADRERYVAGANADLTRLMDEWGVTSLRKFIQRKAFDYMDSEHVDAETALEHAVSDFAKTDRSAPAEGGRADWDTLKRSPQPDDEIADASRQAEKAPAPPDTPEKAVSAAQKAAADADKLLADILPSLSEDERKTFEDALADLQHDTETREQIVRDGAACLAAAAA